MGQTYLFIEINSGFFSDNVLISFKGKDSKEAALKKNLTPADEIHCILYVISAKTNITTKTSKSINIMKSILQRKQKDGKYFF